jgi:uncharacterized glyoxalase superfamily protein PhnB
MTSKPKNTRANLVPCFAYRDPNAAIKWLKAAFSFKEHSRFEDKGRVVHAELSFGNGMIMLGVWDPKSPFGRFLIHPSDIEGKQTQAPYIIVEDAEATYVDVKAAMVKGGEMLIDIHTADYGGRGFTCSDPEGHIWSIGEYDPWAQ